MDRFRELETFVTVVDAGSFVQAAELLRASKTAVSRLVQDLERLAWEPDYYTGPPGACP